MNNRLSLFFDYLRFPSVSAAPKHADDVRACANWLAGTLADWGLAAQIIETAGAPVVLAKTPVVSGQPTLLLYGHYDVQPVEPLDLWESQPFEPELRNGMVFARGATDNKGQTFSHLLGLKDMMEHGLPPINVTVILEGEEEVGSPHFSEFLRDQVAELQCEAVLISDTSMIAPGWPALTLGLRGIACFDISAMGPDRDLHSGMFGGATPNPALALSRVLARMHDASGRVTIPGFYDGLIPVAAGELESWAALPWTTGWFTDATGVAPTGGEIDRSVLERVWSRPTAEINGITAGHQGDGSKTIVPALATAKLSFRLVPGQQPQMLAPILSQWFESELQKEGVRGRAVYDHGGDPFYCSPDHPAIRAACQAIIRVFGRAPSYTREGLSIPAAVMLHETLDVPVILLGLGLPDCQAHAPNESYPAAHLETGARVFKELCCSLVSGQAGS